MALATRCTSCSTIFRISTAQAAAKGGAVRCGACNNVFNSLDALVRVEDLDVIEEVTIEPSGPGESTEATAEAPAPVVDEPPASPPVEEPPTPVVEAVTANLTAESTLGAASFMFDHEGGRPAEPVAPPGAVINEWWMPNQDDTRRLGPDEPLSIAGPEGRTTGAVTTLVTRGPALDDEDGAEAPPEASEPVFLRPESPPERTPRAMRWAFAFLSLAAALILVAQLAYWYRDDVAVQWPSARPWLVAACRPLGCTVGFPIHAESITIESAAVQTAATSPNAYVLVALLRNRDVVALRYPTLELVLTDVQDKPVLRRDLRPEDYLAGVAGHAPGLGFPAESELPVRVAFELTDLRFAGYRLNQIYP